MFQLDILIEFSSCFLCLFLSLVLYVVLTPRKRQKRNKTSAIPFLGGFEVCIKEKKKLALNGPRGRRRPWTGIFFFFSKLTPLIDV